MGFVHFDHIDSFVLCDHIALYCSLCYNMCLVLTDMKSKIAAHFFSLFNYYLFNMHDNCLTEIH